MKRTIVLLLATVFTSIMGLAVAQPSQAACGQQDYLREPMYGPWLNWASGSTWTRIEPHGGLQMRAAIGRYTGSGVVYYYGGWVQNPYPSTSSSVSSRVTASNGINSGNYYSVNGSTDAVDRRVNSLYNDYHYCKFSTY
jgi:hypothetical protein